MTPNTSMWRIVLPAAALSAAVLCIAGGITLVRLIPRRAGPAPEPKPETVVVPRPEVPAVRPRVIPAEVVGHTPPATEDVRPRPLDDRPTVPIVRELPGPPKTETRSTLPAELQEKVNKAIERGLAHLQEQQKKDGSWDDNHPVALAALPGLTLLECGVPAKDERVQRAARYVRDHLDKKVDRHCQTYTVSLAVLFLDRLGDARDRPLIRSLGLRLIAGQKADGGWTYESPPLPAKDEEKLRLALTLTRPPELAKLVKAIAGPGAMEAITTGPLTPTESGKPEKPGSVREMPATSEDDIRKAVADLPEGLRRLPGLGDTPVKPGGRPGAKPGRRIVSSGSDNSNTQLATLALWAAMRHGVPCERALRHLAARFHETQRADGRWNYHPNAAAAGWGSPAMTGVGLLGLAVGHGLRGEDARKSAPTEEPVKRGLDALGKLTGGPDTKDLYFLWTLERVGVLYGVKEIGGKDWYRHAVDVLLHEQQWNGAWNLGGYHGSTKTLDTCLALLILKRANFTAELSRHLEGGLIGGK